ncbi:MAG: MarR family transcriptional regulator [Pseudomonadota bacterium]
MDQILNPPKEVDGKTPGEGSDAQARDNETLRLWLRLFATANAVEAELSRRLRAEFSMTLPRFDLMAQLAKSEEDLTLGTLSRRLMVTNGNITGLVDRLVDDGLVQRRVRRADRRSATVRLTEEGRARFDEMAVAHRAWINELFGGLDASEQAALARLLKCARDTVIERL